MRYVHANHFPYSLHLNRAIFLFDKRLKNSKTPSKVKFYIGIVVLNRINKMSILQVCRLHKPLPLICVLLWRWLKTGSKFVFVLIFF